MNDEQRTTWEYLAIPETDHGRLASLGGEGWELVAAGAAGDEPLLYLKRPRLDFRERVTLEQRDAYLTGSRANRTGTVQSVRPGQ